MALPGRIGRKWEDYALKHLRNAGLELEDRNVQCRFGELDLILREGETLVFVEVRFRKNADFGSGAESVSLGKRRRLASAAQFYLGGHARFADMPCRFDVVAIGPGEPPRVEWIRHAFTLDDL